MRAAKRMPSATAAPCENAVAQAVAHLAGEPASASARSASSCIALPVTPGRASTCSFALRMARVGIAHLLGQRAQNTVRVMSEQ